MSDPRPMIVWRDGNRLGKSIWLATEALDTVRQVQPAERLRNCSWCDYSGLQTYRRPTGRPIHVMVMGTSLEQMEPLMRKLWMLAPRHELDPRNGYDIGRGITGKPPRLVFVTGPGKGGSIKFATYRQGPGRFAGDALDLVVMDEPPTEAVYGEVRPRTVTRGGRIRVGLTPTTTSPPQHWLRELIEEGAIGEHNYGLTEESCWAEGARRPWLTQTTIDAMEAELVPAERAMRMGLSWDPIVSDRWLTGFDDNCILDAFPLQMGVEYGIGLDHGRGAGRQAAMLIAVEGGYTDDPRVWFLDEELSDGVTDPSMDADALVNLIERNGLRYDQISYWIGDRSLEARKAGARKSNKQLRYFLSLALNRHYTDTMRIDVPKKNAGSVMAGVQLLNSLFVRRRGYVRPRCERFRAAALNWAGAPKDPHKDILDAGRYIVERMVRPGAWMATSMLVG